MDYQWNLKLSLGSIFGVQAGNKPQYDVDLGHNRRDVELAPSSVNLQSG